MLIQQHRVVFFFPFFFLKSGKDTSPQDIRLPFQPESFRVGGSSLIRVLIQQQAACGIFDLGLTPVLCIRVVHGGALVATGVALVPELISPW